MFSKKGWRGLTTCKGDSPLATAKIQQYIIWHDGSDMENVIISCQAKFLEASGIKDALGDKKVVGSNVVNSVVEGIYY